jgi:hypothetical protein
MANNYRSLTPNKFNQRLLIIVSLLILIIGISKVHGMFNNRHEISDIKNARSKKALDVESTIGQQDELLKQLGVVGEKVASSKVDFCSVDSRDAGWFAQSYGQICGLQYAEVYTANANKETLIQRVSNSPLSSKLFGRPIKDLTYPTCDAFESKSFHGTLLYLPAPSNDSQNITKGCAIPNLGNRTPSQQGSTKVFYTFDRTSLPDADTIWVVHNDGYYSKDLGCGIQLFFCFSPRKTPLIAP